MGSNIISKPKIRVSRFWTVLFMLFLCSMISNYTRIVQQVQREAHHDLNASLLSIDTSPYENQKLQNVAGHQKMAKPEFGLLVVHCMEVNTTFYDEVPDDWMFDVYETCRETSSPDHSVPFRNNKQSEECSSYLDFIARHYYELPEIVIFLQADGLDGYGKPQRNYAGHSPFRSVAHMHSITRQIILEQNLTQFLHYGPNLGRWYGETIAHASQPQMQEPLLRLWTHHLNLPLNDTARTKTRPMATFAVHRDRIMARPIGFYTTLRDEILAKPFAARPTCFVLENTWHVIFGEPWILPKQSTVDHIPRTKWNIK